MNPTDKPDQTSARSGFRSPLGWVLTALLFLGASWLGSRTFETPSGNGTASMSATAPIGRNSVAPAPPAGQRKMVRRTLYLPDDQGVLRSQIVTDEMTERAATTPLPAHAYEAEATRTLRLLLLRSPSDFPAHTHVLGVRVDKTKKIADVDFDAHFTDPKFWQGSTRTTATLGALLKTLMDVKPVVVEKIQFLVAGKPVDTVGGFDISDPLTANEIAGSGENGAAPVAEP